LSPGGRNGAADAFCLVHVKLKGCGTHIEQIVSVHDLFR
jgi:hypothetical protein